MHEHETDHEPVEEEGEARPLLEITDPEPEPNSLFDQLAQKRQRAVESKDGSFIPVPGYDKEPPVLLAKYRLLEGKEVDAIGRKVVDEVKGRWNRQVLAAVDTMIESCDGLYIDLGDGEDPQPLTLGGAPIPGFNRELAVAMKFEGELHSGTAREVVFALFVNNEVAIMEHSVRLSRWMGNTTRRVDEELLGEG